MSARRAAGGGPRTRAHDALENVEVVKAVGRRVGVTPSAVRRLERVRARVLGHAVQVRCARKGDVEADRLRPEGLAVVVRTEGLLPQAGGCVVGRCGRGRGGRVSGSRVGLSRMLALVLVHGLAVLAPVEHAALFGRGRGGGRRCTVGSALTLRAAVLEVCEAAAADDDKRRRRTAADGAAKELHLEGRMVHDEQQLGGRVERPRRDSRAAKGGCERRVRKEGRRARARARVANELRHECVGRVKLPQRYAHERALEDDVGRLRAAREG